VTIESRIDTGTPGAADQSATDPVDPAEPCATRDPSPASLEDARPRASADATLDQSAIGRLIAKDYIGLRLLITRRTGDREVAADLLNDAVCKTWEKWRAGQIQRPHQIGGYIFQVAMNLLRNYRRTVADRPDRRAGLERLDQHHVAENATDTQLEEQVASKVKQLIRGMDSHRDRTVLVRFYLDEDDKDSICRDLGLSALQFDKILHRARLRLRGLLESHGFRGSDFLSVLWIA
jgi:RNA polymerase sigma-70 factor, ECF subfamily